MKSVIVAFFLLFATAFAQNAPSHTQSQAKTQSQARDAGSANHVTYRGCVARELDGYYLIADGGKKYFLAGGKNASASANYVAVIEGEEGGGSNTYAGATGQNTTPAIHVKKIETTGTRCNLSAFPEPTPNHDSTYGPGNPK